MVFQYTQAQVADIDLSLTAHNYVAAYIKAADHADGVPGADPAVVSWLRGAAEVNGGDGAFADFIRGYTAAQYHARFGTVITESQLDEVSNDIAEAVLGYIVSTGELPSLSQIATDDAHESAQSLFQGDAGGWAGNPLFLGLGVAAPLADSITETPGDTYDALAMIKFTLGTPFEPDWTAVKQALSALGHGLTILSGFVETNGFLSEAYGGAFPALEAAADKIILGRVDQGDELVGTAGGDIVHGGGGDDTLVGSSGSDILDGGAGVDAASYAGSAAIDVIVKSEPASTAKYTARVTGPGEQALFSIETIAGSGQDDAFHIQSVPTLDAPLSLLGGAGDDTLDTFYLPEGAIVDAVAGALVSGGDTVTFAGFEKYEGGNEADIFILDLTAKSVDAGGGDDIVALTSLETEIQGGDGVDTLSFQFMDTGVVFNMTSGIGFEQVIGSTHNDKITAKFATGYEGNDTMIGAGLLDQIEGGAGNDSLSGGGGYDTLLGDGGMDLLRSTGFDTGTVLDGGAGDDVIRYLDGGGVTIKFTTGSGHDFLATDENNSENWQDVVIDFGEVSSGSVSFTWDREFDHRVDLYDGPEWWYGYREIYSGHAVLKLASGDTLSMKVTSFITYIEGIEDYGVEYVSSMNSELLQFSDRSIYAYELFDEMFPQPQVPPLGSVSQYLDGANYWGFA